MKSRSGLDQLLHRHFPDCSEKNLKKAADDLEIHFSLSVGWQMAEQAERPIQVDLRSMQHAAKKLAQAERLIRGVGFVGGAFLVEAAQNLDSFEGDQFVDHRPGKLQSVDIVASNIGFLQKIIADAVSAALASGNSSAATSRKRGAPRKRSAGILTLALYDSFTSLTGKVPTVSTNRATDEKYGPFLAFVSDVFTYLEIDASPANMARQACREKNAKNG